MIEANWTTFIYDYAYKFNNFVGAMLYFDIFHMLI